MLKVRTLGLILSENIYWEKELNKVLTVRKTIIKEFVKDKSIVHHIIIGISFLVFRLTDIELRSPDQDKKRPFIPYPFCQ